jgi:hypothetical protein
MDKMDEKIYEDIRKINNDRRGKPISPIIIIALLAITMGSLVFLVQSGNIGAPTALVIDDKPMRCFFSSTWLSASSNNAGIICSVGKAGSGVTVQIENTISLPAQTPMVVEMISLNSCDIYPNATIAIKQSKDFAIGGCDLLPLGNNFTVRYRNIETSLTHTIRAELR